MDLRKIYFDRIKALEAIVPSRGDIYTKDSDSRFDGLSLSFDMLPDTGPEMSTIHIIAMLYSCEDSRYYHDDSILYIINDACDALERKINADGTTNLLVSNFHTAEQFGLEGLSHIASVWNKYRSHSEAEEVSFSKLKHVLRRLGDGCLCGGFHTPNHRWIETSGLLLAYSVLGEGNEDLLEKAERYMAEGIDCDEYGEFSERSAGMYNAHCDKAFLDIYRASGRKEFLDAACRNLRLMQYYLNDDFTMFTQNSRRKDKGEVGAMPMFSEAMTYHSEVYCEHYLDAACLTGDPFFAKMSEEIYEHARASGRWGGYTLRIFLDYPELKDNPFDTSSVKLARNYESYLPDSNIVRYKKDGLSVSFLAQNSSFLQMDYHDIKLRVKMCSSFFAVAQFIPDKLEKTDTGYRMKMHAHAEYKLPLEHPDESCKHYWTIDYNARKSIQNQDLYYTADLTINDDGVSLHVSAQGCEDVPFKLELITSPNLNLITDDTVIRTGKGGNAFVRKGDIDFFSPFGYHMTVKGAFSKHLYALNMRGSESQTSDAFTVYCTDFTPCDHTIDISFGKNLSAPHIC